MASFFLFRQKSAGEESAGILNELRDMVDAAYSWAHLDGRMGVAIVSPLTKPKKSADQETPHRDAFFADKQSGRCIVSDSRLDYRHELAGGLGIKPTEADNLSDCELILLAHSAWGEECLSHMYGDFSFVIWDPRTDEVFCARDHLGNKPFYYLDQPGFLAVASQIAAFKYIPGFRFEIKEQYILDALCSIVRSDTNSSYKGISKLKPAHSLKFTQGKSSGQYRYWDLQTKEEYQRLTLEAASRGLKERFIEAIRQRSNSTDAIGVELSGGLDSSGVASVLTILTNEKTKINAFTHSVTSEVPAYSKSEMEFSSALPEKYHSIRHFEITEKNAEGGFRSLTKALSILYKPLNLHYAINSDLLFEKAGQLGTNVMYSGFGGDEGISNQGNGYWNELIGKGQHVKLRMHIKGMVYRHGGSFYKSLIKCYLNFYMPRAFLPYRKDWRRDMYRSFAIEKSLARKYQMKRRFFRSNPPPVKPDVRAMQYFRLMYPNIPERMEETALLAQQHGLEYRYPFLDVKLLEFFYSLPSEYKYRDGMGRYLFRQIMDGILPDKIRMRTHKSGTTIPNVFARLFKDRARFQEMINESRQRNQYHYVDYKKLQTMLDILKNKDAFKEEDFDLRAFQSAMSVLILQQWQRDGKIDIGIKC